MTNGEQDSMLDEIEISDLPDRLDLSQIDDVADDTTELERRILINDIVSRRIQEITHINADLLRDGLQHGNRRDDSKHKSASYARQSVSNEIIRNKGDRRHRHGDGGDGSIKSTKAHRHVPCVPDVMPPPCQRRRSVIEGVNPRLYPAVEVKQRIEEKLSKIKQDEESKCTFKPTVNKTPKDVKIDGDVVDRMTNWERQRKRKLEAHARQIRAHEEKESTFKPTTNVFGDGNETRRTTTSVFKRLTSNEVHNRRDANIERERQMKLDLERAECTFQPRLNNDGPAVHPRYKQHRPPKPAPEEEPLPSFKPAIGPLPDRLGAGVLRYLNDDVSDRLYRRKRVVTAVREMEVQDGNTRGHDDDLQDDDGDVEQFSEQNDKHSDDELNAESKYRLQPNKQNRYKFKRDVGETKSKTHEQTSKNDEYNHDNVFDYQRVFKKTPVNDDENESDIELVDDDDDGDKHGNNDDQYDRHDDESQIDDDDDEREIEEQKVEQIIEEDEWPLQLPPKSDYMSGFDEPPPLMASKVREPLSSSKHIKDYNIAKRAEMKEMHERDKHQDEMDKCTFTPRINPKTALPSYTASISHSTVRDINDVCDVQRLARVRPLKPSKPDWV